MLPAEASLSVLQDYLRIFHGKESNLCLKVSGEERRWGRGVGEEGEREEEEWGRRERGRERSGGGGREGGRGVGGGRVRVGTEGGRRKRVGKEE